MDVSMQIKKTALRTALGYIEKNPEENVLKLMDWVDKLAGDGPNSFPAQRKAFRNVLNDPECSMYQLIMSVFRDIDNDVLKVVFENFFHAAPVIKCSQRISSGLLLKLNIIQHQMLFGFLKIGTERYTDHARDNEEYNCI